MVLVRTNGSQTYDLIGVGRLLPGREAEAIVADKGFDADTRVPEFLAQAAVIPHKAHRDDDCHPLRGTPPDRERLPRAHAVQGHRNSIRQGRSELPWRHPRRRNSLLAQLPARPGWQITLG